MKEVENTKGLVKYQNLLNRMYKDFDVLPIGNIPTKDFDGVYQQVVIELVKGQCMVVISKTDKGYSVFIDVKDNYETLYYNGEEYVSFKDLKHLLKQIDFDYFIRRITNEIIIGEHLVDILDDDLPF